MQPNLTKSIRISKPKTVDSPAIILYNNKQIPIHKRELNNKMLKDNLISLRKANGFSQEEIAEKIGISRQAYGKWETGDTIPDIEKCCMLSRVYGVSIDSLVRDSEVIGNTAIAPAPKGKHIFGSITLSERGQIVIPKEARELFDLKTGDRLLLLGDEDQGLALMKESVFLANMNDTLAKARRSLD